MNTQENKKKLRKALNNINNIKPSVCIIGDLILDEYIVGSPERISREAPVLILETTDKYYRLGGAANAAVNASRLGAKVTLIGISGKDIQANIITNICMENNINLKLIKSSQRKTSLKTRIFASNQSIQNQTEGNNSIQQILRLDTIDKSTISSKIEKKLINIINNIEEEYILLSDYQLGVLSPKVIKALNNSNKKILADLTKNFNRLSKAYLITPNKPDAEKELNININFETKKDIKEIYNLLKNKLLEQENILITKGSKGMTLIEINNKKAFNIPAFNKTNIFDVTGAGDTVVGILLASLASGNNLLDSIILGNIGASIVVSSIGPTSTTIQEIKVSIDKLNINIKEFNL